MTTLATILEREIAVLGLDLTTKQVYLLANAVENSVLEAQRGGFRVTLTEMHYLFKPFALYRTPAAESPIYDQLQAERAKKDE